jgi:hypothetical protein
VERVAGFNASFGESVTIANTTSTTVPPIKISYGGIPATGQVGWNYSQPGNQVNASTTTTLYDQWIWAIPFDQEQNIARISFLTNANLSYYNNGIEDSVNAQFSTTIPLPFGSTFTLTKPNVTGVSPITVQPGDLFTIEGTGLYPSLIQGVYIGGQPVDMANVVPISDTAVEILAPNTTSKSPQSVVVRTNRGFSNNNVKIIIQTLSSRALGGRQQRSHQFLPLHRPAMKLHQPGMTSALQGNPVSRHNLVFRIEKGTWTEKGTIVNGIKPRRKFLA